MTAWQDRAREQLVWKNVKVKNQKYWTAKRGTCGEKRQQQKPGDLSCKIWDEPWTKE